MSKLSSGLWLILVMGMPLMSIAQKCSISEQDKTRMDTLSKGNLNFALNLYKGLEENENLFFSPFSISVALAMVTVGTEGNTLKQMKDVLNLNEFNNGNQIDSAFLSLLDSICSNSNYTLSTANKIFIRNNFLVQKPFLNTLANNYKSSAENVDFGGNPDGVASQINAWVENQTHNHIKDLFTPGTIDPLTVLALVNAIYFKGAWLKPFDERNTKPEEFKLTNGQTVSVPMMSIRGPLKYAESKPLDSRMLQLDYKGNRLVMYVILPNQNNGLAQLQQQLTPDAFNSFRKQLSFTDIEVKIPKFKLNFKQQLNELLKRLGMTHLFNENKANLTRISKDGQLYISKVIHQAFVEVDERGTTAAAATGGLAYPRVEPPTFYADHPFIFIIYDTLTDLILFMGNVDNPKQ